MIHATIGDTCHAEYDGRVQEDNGRSKSGGAGGSAAARGSPGAEAGTSAAATDVRETNADVGASIGQSGSGRTEDITAGESPARVKIHSGTSYYSMERD